MDNCPKCILKATKWSNGQMAATISLDKAIAFLEIHVLPSYDELFAAIVYDPISCLDVISTFKEKVIRKIQKEKNLTSYCVLVITCQRLFHNTVRELLRCY